MEAIYLILHSLAALCRNRQRSCDNSRRKELFDGLFIRIDRTGIYRRCIRWFENAEREEEGSDPARAVAKIKDQISTIHPDGAAVSPY